MASRKTKKTEKAFDIVNGREFEVEVDEDGARKVMEPFPTFESDLNIPEQPGEPNGPAEKTLAAHGMFDMLEKAKQATMPKFSPLDLNMVMEEQMTTSPEETEFSSRYEHLVRTRDLPSILCAILRELVTIRMGMSR